MIELNTNDKVVLPKSSLKKKLQLVNGKLSLVNYDGSITPITSTTSITNNIVNEKLDIFGILQEQINNRINSLIPLIDSKATKEELISAFDSIQSDLTEELVGFKDYVDVLNSNTTSVLNESITSEVSSLNSDITSLYELNSSLSDDLVKLVSSLKSNSDSSLSSIKDQITGIVSNFTNELSTYKDYVDSTYAKIEDLPVVPNLIPGNNINISEDSNGDLVISAILPKFVGGTGGGASVTLVNQLIATAIQGISGGVSSGTGSVTGNFVTLDTPQSITGKKTFDITGDNVVTMKAATADTYSELTWNSIGNSKFGLYGSDSIVGVTAPWLTGGNGKYFGLYGYDLGNDIFSIDSQGNTTSKGTLSAQTLPLSANSGTILVNNGKVITDSGTTIQQIYYDNIAFNYIFSN